MWVRISAPNNSRLTFFTLICCKNGFVCLKRPKINEKRPRMAHLKNKMNNFRWMILYLCKCLSYVPHNRRGSLSVNYNNNVKNNIVNVLALWGNWGPACSSNAKSLSYKLILKSKMHMSKQPHCLYRIWSCRKTGYSYWQKNNKTIESHSTGRGLDNTKTMASWD